MRVLGCSENIKNHIFYKPDSNNGCLIYMEKVFEEKNSNFKFLATGVAIWKFEKSSNMAILSKSYTVKINI